MVQYIKIYYDDQHTVIIPHTSTLMRIKSGINHISRVYHGIVHTVKVCIAMMLPLIWLTETPSYMTSRARMDRVTGWRMKDWISQLQCVTMSRIQLRTGPRKKVKIYSFNVYSFHHHRRFLFNGGPESQPSAGSMPVNCVRRWLNTTATLTKRMILLHQRLQESLDG